MDSGKSFDITAATRAICEHMSANVDELSHIDMSRVAVGYCQTRKNVSHGIQASLTPLRFEAGATVKTVAGRQYACQRIVTADGRECLYLLNLYLPRFQNLPFDEKLTTIVHELWHISPRFDGDLRRHQGRCHVHGRSQAAFDAHAAALAKAWLSQSPSAELHDWLRCDFRGLCQRVGSIIGTRYPAPKLIPLAASAARSTNT
jgi:predicted metallopeptidase